MRASALAIAAVTLMALAPGAAAQAAGDLPAECHAGSKTSATSLTNGDGDQRNWRVSWSSGDCSWELSARGTIAFADDLSDVSAISPGGWFELTERTPAHTRRYEVRPSRGGTLERSSTLDGHDRPVDDESRRWLAGMLVRLDRRTAFAAPSRVHQLLAQGGVSRVLAEISRVDADYARRIYFTTLLDSARIGDDDARRIMTQAGAEIHSDYELATLLLELGTRGLVTARNSAAYVQATTGLHSDYEHRRALMGVLGVKGLDPAVVNAALQSAAKIGSDYELTEFLIAVGQHGLLTDETRDAYFAAVQRVKSDYEHRRALTGLLEEGKLTKAMLGRVLDGATGMSSDYERASLLVSIAERYALDQPLRDAYVRAADGIGSDYERRRALSALVKRTTL